MRASQLAQKNNFDTGNKVKVLDLYFEYPGLSPRSFCSIIGMLINTKSRSIIIGPDKARGVIPSPAATPKRKIENQNPSSPK